MIISTITVKQNYSGMKPTPCSACTIIIYELWLWKLIFIYDTVRIQAINKFVPKTHTFLLLSLSKIINVNFFHQSQTTRRRICIQKINRNLPYDVKVQCLWSASYDIASVSDPQSGFPYQPPYDNYICISSAITKPLSRYHKLNKSSMEKSGTLILINPYFCKSSVGTSYNSRSVTGVARFMAQFANHREGQRCHDQLLLCISITIFIYHISTIRFALFRYQPPWWWRPDELLSYKNCRLLRSGSGLPR